jgi:hypothetical protein
MFRRPNIYFKLPYFKISKISNNMYEDTLYSIVRVPILNKAICAELTRNNVCFEACDTVATWP